MISIFVFIKDGDIFTVQGLVILAEILDINNFKYLINI